MKFTQIPVLLGLSIVSVFATPNADATALILNGGFESGFTSWVRADQLGSEGTFSLQSGLLSPVGGFPVPAPPQGTTAAMTDAFGPGSHVLYQNFLVPAGTASLTFSLFIGNRADRFVTPATLDFSTPALNQQARVDILNAASDPFSLSSSDILFNLYRSDVGSPLITGYNNFTFDLTTLFAANVGQTLRLRFAETDNLAPFQFGVDNVQLESPSVVPEPQSIVLLGVGVLALLTIRRRF